MGKHRNELNVIYCSIKNSRVCRNGLLYNTTARLSAKLNLHFTKHNRGLSSSLMRSTHDHNR